MARTTGSNGAKTQEAIRRAGIKRIYEQGFEAMKLRDLAADVGLQAGSLYNYIQQKEDFLFVLLKEIMDELHAGLEAELDGVTHPLAALNRFVEFHLRWHTARREEVFIGNMELRSLSPPNYKVIAGLRRRYEERLQAILEGGNAARAWSVPDPQVATYAVISMLTGVCTWWRPNGRLSQDEIVETYRALVLNTVSVRHA